MLLMSSMTALSAELLLDDGMLSRYALHLYRNGEYYRAVSEYKRLLHFFPDSEYAGKADLQIGRSYMAGGRFDEAIGYWESRIKARETEGASLGPYRILYGISLLDLNRADPFRMRREQVLSAMTAFSGVADEDPGGRRIRDFVDDWKALPEPETKSPWLAGSMSAVIPGSGSFYTGRKLEGVYAFFLSGLFWLATADAMRNENDALTGLFGFFTLTFYGGNIYTAVNSAHKYNDRLWSTNLQRLREQHGVWFIPENLRRSGQF